MKIFDYDHYRHFLQAWLAQLPNQGHGQLVKIANSLDIHPSVVTLVLQGKKDFNLEQASDLATHLELSDLESEYLFVLVNQARAGRDGLRKRLQRQAQKIRAQASTLKDLLPPQKELSEEAKSVFYSQWYYSAIRILSSVEQYQSAEALARRLELPRAKVKDILDFLVRHGLCEERDGKFIMGPQSTHLGASSPLVTRHHANWRERSIFQLEKMREDELFFTSPISIATKDLQRVRKILVAAIEDAFKVIDPSPCEEVACLNIDLFRF